MSEKLKVAYQMQVSIGQYHEPEMLKHTLKVVRQCLENYCEDEGMKRLGTIKELPPFFFRYEKEHHHKHGWQLTQAECPETEAEHVLLRVEARVKEKKR